VNQENGLLIPRDGHAELTQAMKSYMKTPFSPKPLDLLSPKKLMDQIDAIYKEIGLKKVHRLQ